MLPKSFCKVIDCLLFGDALICDMGEGIDSYEVPPFPVDRDPGFHLWMGCRGVLFGLCDITQRALPMNN